MMMDSFHDVPSEQQQYCRDDQTMTHTMPSDHHEPSMVSVVLDEPSFQAVDAQSISSLDHPILPVITHDISEVPLNPPQSIPPNTVTDHREEDTSLSSSSQSSSDTDDDPEDTTHMQKKPKTEKEDTDHSDPRDDSLVSNSNDADANCSICFEPWSNAGPHRLCCLKCGHLFGKQCIEKWITSQITKSHRLTKCPQCNTKAKKSDIRILYAPKCLSTVDTTERDAALRSLRDAEQKHSVHQEERLSMIMKYELVRGENERLRSELLELRQRATFPASIHNPLHPSILPPPVFHNGFVLEHSLVVSRENKAKCLDYDPHLECLIVSDCLDKTPKSPSHSTDRPSTMMKPLFPFSYGIHKISLMDGGRSRDSLRLHAKDIKCLQASPFHAGWLATASLDRTVKIIQLASHHVVHTFQCPSPVWSCTWHSEHQLLCGLANNQVLLLDLRERAILQSIPNSTTDRSLPIHSLVSVNALSRVPRDRNTVIGATSSGPFMIQWEAGDMTAETIPRVVRLPTYPERALCTHIAYEPHTDALMTSFRPSHADLLEAHARRASHCISQVTTERAPVLFEGDAVSLAMTSRAVLMPAMDRSEGLMVCTVDDRAASIQLRRLSMKAREGIEQDDTEKDSSGVCDSQRVSLYQQWALNQSVVDMKGVLLGGERFLLAILSTSELHLYRWSEGGETVSPLLPT